MTKRIVQRTGSIGVLAGLVVALVVASSVDGRAASLGDPDYREGFGKDATGGDGYSTYVVTSSAATGPGTFYQAFQPGNRASNKRIIFAVPTVTLPTNVYIGSNVTIDGMANGMNGVTMNATANAKRGLVIEDPATNIVIRGINFRSTGTPNSGVTEFDLLALDGTNGGTISNVLIDRCTFFQASDGALDITGNVSNVTVQRSLFHGNAITMLVKYGRRQNISIHHNVFTRNGERNPQVKGDVRLLDFVNNIVHINLGDVTNYPDGGGTDPYGLRIWNANSSSDSPGNVTINVVNNAHLGNRGGIQITTESGASAAGVYLGGNHCVPASNCRTSPRATPNPVPVDYEVTTLAVGQIRAMLPYVGAPNRTAVDQQRLDELAALLPDSESTPPTSPPPPPPAAPPAPTNLTVR